MKSITDKKSSMVIEIKIIGAYGGRNQLEDGVK